MFKEKCLHIDHQWLKYLKRFRDLTLERYKYKLENKVSVDLYNAVLSDRNIALDYITILCDDIENILIENHELSMKVKMMEEGLIQDD